MGAFSLLELIGVMAIVAILAALLLPRMIKRIDIATRVQEIANLAAIRDALQLDVVRNATLTNNAGWAQAAARWCPLPESQIYTNARRWNRIYFIQSSPNPSSSPYIQTANGTTLPANLRAMVISTLAGPPLNLTTLTDNEFNDAWSTPDGSRPTVGNWASWSGTGDDFLIQRIDYAPLFHRLVLVNRDTVPASFTINGSTAVTLNHTVPNVGWDSYYIHGSVVGLCTNGVTNVTVTVHVLTRDIGFVFEDGLWRPIILGENITSSLADNFGAQAAAFLAAQWNTSAFQGADQQGVLTAMYTFMYTYTLWANQCPHFPSHGATAVQVPEWLMLQSMGDPPNARLDQFSSYLVR